MAHKARVAEFDSVLQADKINLDKLRNLCFSGVPDEGGRRALCWSLLLHYLPPDRTLWSDHLKAKRTSYHAFVDDIIVKASKLSNSSEQVSSNNSSHQHNRSQSYSDHAFLTNSINNIKLDDSSSVNRKNSLGSSDKNHSETRPTTQYSASSNSIADNLRSQSSSSDTAMRGSGSSNSICSDHPLNLSPDSEWVSFFRDNEILGQIDKDVRRLCPDMCFFQRPTSYPRANTPRLSARVTYTPLRTTVTSSSQSIKKQNLRKNSRDPSPPPLPPGSEHHWEVVERVLFVYAKLNPGQGYVQGMNEIVGPLYYVLATSPTHAEHAEADCFWLLTALMADVRDLFIRTLDESESGIGRLMTRLMTGLAVHDAPTAARLARQGIREQYFAFRWLSLLFCQEFELPDVIRVWDSALSRLDTLSFLLQFATAMIVLQRDSILEGDFAANMKLLQNYPPCDIALILNKAAQLAAADASS